MITSYIECACSDASHIIRVTSNPEDKELYVEVQLNPYYGFFKRLWLGVLYVLGVRPKFGHWDSTLLNLEQNNDLLRVILTHKLTCDRDQTAAKKIQRALKSMTWPHIEDMKRVKKSK